MIFPFVVVIAILYFAREFLIPIALAVLVSFLLAPAVRRLERIGFGRITAVLTMTFLTLFVVLGLFTIIGRQLIDLANELPKYKVNLNTKIAAIKAPHHTPIDSAVRSVQDLATDISKQEKTVLSRPATAAK